LQIYHLLLNPPNFGAANAEKILFSLLSRDKIQQTKFWSSKCRENLIFFAESRQNSAKLNFGAAKPLSFYSM